MNYEQIFQSQKDFFFSQKTKEIPFRKENLSKLRDLLKSNENLLLEAIYKDFRKSAFDVYTNELNLIYAEINYFLKNLDQLNKPKKVKTGLPLLPAKSRIYYEPLGCTLIIGAWNYPYSLTLIPVISAIAAGNTCMIKPSELPANTMHVMARLINTNFPSEYLHVIEGGVSETTAILELPYDKIFFTGSPRVGKIVYEAAARNLTPVTLELGGKSPVIVTSKANLKIAAKRIVWGKYLNAGQTCVAPDYLLVEDSIKPRLLELIKQRLTLSSYSDGAEHYVSIINKRNFDRIIRLIDKTKTIYGGSYNEQTLYIEPTVMDNVNWNDPIMQEEIFGPILPVLSYTDFEETLQQIIFREKPLAAYLFSTDRNEKEKFLNTVSFGGGCINDTIMHLTGHELPFGGVGNSGMGNYHGKAGFLTFSHQKSILDKSNYGEPNIKYPPYSEKKLKWVKRLF